VRIGRAGAGPQRTIVEKIRSGASIIIGHAAWRLLILRSCSCLSVQYSLRTEDCGPKNVLFYKKPEKKRQKKSIAFGFNEFAADLGGAESAALIFPKPCLSRI